MLAVPNNLRRPRSLQLLASLLLVCIAAQATAQNKDLGPLYMQPPFDRVILKTGEKVDVQKLRFPDGTRNIPSVLPAAGELKVRPLAAQNAAAQYTIPWTAISRVDLFETMIMQEALRLTAASEFDAAYPYFSHLLKRAPTTAGLNSAINRYLQSDALAAYQAGEFDRALAILGSLHARSPNAEGLAGAVNTVAGKIIEQYLQSRNYKSARLTLDVVDKTFDGLRLTVIDSWRQRFQQAAAAQLAEATRLVESRNYLAARQAINQAVGVWPELAGVVELQARLQREHPIVSVGVVERSPRQPKHRLDSNASSRAASLISPKVMELREYSAEGGVYRTSIGQYELDPSGMQLTIQLADPPPGEPLAASLGASTLARQLVDATIEGSPQYNDVLAKLIKQVNVEHPQQVQVLLRRPHVRPESQLSLAMDTSLAKLSDRGVFSITEYNDSLVRFAADASYRGAIAEIHEVAFEDDDQAVTALSQGIVDVLDRVPPWQLARLRAADGVVVGNYLLPTVHVLVPTGRSPLTEQREFRRALCYGIDRTRFVDKVLLAGSGRGGFQAISGPFPAGIELSDPIRYGYNGQIKPRPYDPYMAIILSSAAWNNTQKSEGVEQPGDAPIPTLKLGHTSDPVARTACIEIAKNLNAVDIPIELVELSVQDMLNADQFVDLKYTELSVWEPVSDARRLLGANGLLGGASDYMMLSLDRLDAARNWNDVRSRLYGIHDVASTDLPVIPLWQTVNYFAYRDNLSGIAPQPVRLFQDIGNWQIEFQPERL